MTKKGKNPNIPNYNRPGQTVLKHESMISQYSGPIPMPQDLERYEQISPGFADRIIAMAEKEQENRFQFERVIENNRKEYAEREQRNDRTGLRNAMATITLFVLLCGFAFYLGYPVHATVMMGGGLVSIVGIFVYRKKKSKQEREDQK